MSAILPFPISDMMGAFVDSAVLTSFPPTAETLNGILDPPNSRTALFWIVRA